MGGMSVIFEPAPLRMQSSILSVRNVGLCVTIADSTIHSRPTANIMYERRISTLLRVCFSEERKQISKHVGSKYEIVAQVLASLYSTHRAISFFCYQRPMNRSHSKTLQIHFYVGGLLSVCLYGRYDWRKYPDNTKSSAGQLIDVASFVGRTSTTHVRPTCSCSSAL
jgi:hypothetical protein